MRIRSGYSFHAAAGHLEDVVDRCAEIGMTTMPLTDRDSTFGFRRLRELCSKKGLKPAYGVELGTVKRLGEKKPIINYCTFLAKENIRAVNVLVQAATDNVGRDPALLMDFALAAQGVFKIIGERATFDQLRDIAAAKDTFLALSPSTPKFLVKTALDVGIKLIATSDNYYTREEDLEFYRVALGRRSNTQTYPQHILSDEEWFEAVKDKVSPEHAQEAKLNREFVLTGLNASLVNAELYKPERLKSLLEMCEAGAVDLGVDLNNPVYAERLERELRLIKEKDFEDYFYIISNIVNWAKDNMIVGPARGSSCGSLVCYLLKITTIDPIPHGLIFERFIDINRKDMPDIDIDFSDKRRDMVFDYMQDQYGKEKVARLGSVGLFKQRSALKQTASVLKIPDWRIEKVIDQSMGSLEETLNNSDAGKALLKDFPNAVIAAQLEDHPNNASQHAAGMLVTKDPIVNYVAIDKRTGAAMVDKRDAEVLNLLKIDALGLTQLSVFERVLQLIGVKDIRGWFEKLPLDDPKAFAILNDQRFSGIFQFMGAALQGLSKTITIDKLDDIVSITALARPGPMATGGANDWCLRRSGAEKVVYPHPLMESLTKDTYGIIVYQEQIMQIARTVGLMSWEDTSELRKTISKSLGEEVFNKFWIKFREGAMSQGMEEHVARKIWDTMKTFGAYAFNKSHAVAYGVVSYYCCYLKAYYPIEFCAATLDAEKDPLKQIQMLRELEKEGVGYIPFDIDHSDKEWNVIERDGKKTLVGPISVVKGIGPAAVNEVIGSRSSGAELRPVLRKKLEKAETEIDTIYPVRDAVAKKYPDLKSAGIVTEPMSIDKIQCGIKDDVVLIGVVRRINMKDDNAEDIVARRGFPLRGVNTTFINMWVMDDSDEILVKIDRFDYEKLGKPIVERGKAGSAIYAFKGTVPPRFRMLSVKNVKFLGMLGE